MSKIEQLAEETFGEEYPDLTKSHYRKTYGIDYDDADYPKFWISQEIERNCIEEDRRYYD